MAGCIIIGISLEVLNAEPTKQRRLFYYKAVAVIETNPATRVIHTEEVPGVSTVIYEDEEHVMVNTVNSGICNDHLDSHIHCEKFLIIQSMQ